MLEMFMRRAGEVLTRYQLLEHVWDYDYENRSNVVDVYVRYLREKIDRPFGRELARDRARRRLPAAERRRETPRTLQGRLTLPFALSTVRARGTRVVPRAPSRHLIDEAVNDGPAVQRGGARPAVARATGEVGTT